MEVSGHFHIMAALHPPPPTPPGNNSENQKYVAGWTPIWTYLRREASFAPGGIRIPDRPARN